jgi:hypothetical protein
MAVERPTRRLLLRPAFAIFFPLRARHAMGSALETVIR